MARHYVLGSWANADEFDYSGEQLMGHRQGKSVCMDHMLPSGMANLKRYGDPVTPPTKTPAKPKLTAFDKICTTDRTYSRLCALSEELDNQLENGELDLTDWSFARKQLDVKLDKAWKAVCRLRNWSESGEPLDNSLESGLSFSLEDIPTYVNGRPNIQAFAEPVTKPKPPAKPKLTAFDKICTTDRTYSRLCALSEELDNQLENGELDLTDWSFARKQLDVKLDRAWKAVCRLRNWNEAGESLDNSLDSGLSFSLEDIQEAGDVGEKQRVKRELTGNQVFDSLSQNNVFLGLFIKVKKIMKIMKTLNNWEK